MARDQKVVSEVLVGVGHNGSARYGSSQKDGRSDLLKDQAANGSNTNRCPFGCEDDELDEQGYCFHLIGFSPDRKFLERNVMDPDGRIRTKASIERVKGKQRFVRERLDLKKHHLDEVTVGGTCRVYEDVPRPDDYPEPEQDELTDEELEEIDAEDDVDGDPEPQKREVYSGTGAPKPGRKSRNRAQSQE